MGLIAVGLTINSFDPLDASLSSGLLLLMGDALALAELVPLLVSRLAYREKIINFPVNTGSKRPFVAKLFLLDVVALGFVILPVYLISIGVFQNRRDAAGHTSFWRLFFGVNAVGIWDKWSSSAPSPPCYDGTSLTGSPTSCRQ